MIGDVDLAQHGFREELKLCRELAAMPFAHEGLQGLAAVAAAHDDVERAARLSGASETHRYDQPQDPVDARIEATFFEPARSRCGLGVWDAAWRDGATLSLEDAIAYALDEPAEYDG
jgi:hypothetical protein